MLLGMSARPSGLTALASPFEPSRVPSRPKPRRFFILREFTDRAILLDANQRCSNRIFCRSRPGSFTISPGRRLIRGRGAARCTANRSSPSRRLRPSGSLQDKLKFGRTSRFWVVLIWSSLLKWEELATSPVSPVSGGYLYDLDI